MWDVIVVGAGPAGCQAAWHLNQLGQKVLLLDRRDFPRRKACGGMLSPLAVSLLPFDIARIHRGISSATLIKLRAGEYRYSPQQAFLTEREEFDYYFFRYVRDSGVPFRRIRGLRKVATRRDSCNLHTTDRELLRARYIVAADGANSTVRRLFAPVSALDTGVALEVNVPCNGHLDEVPVGFDFSWMREGYAWYFPKGDHLNIGIGTFTHGHLSREAIAALLADFPAVTRKDTFGAPLSPFLGQAHTGQGNVLFVGDAAGLVDPMSGEGIYEALYSGRCAAQAIAEGGGDVLGRYQDLLSELTYRLSRKLGVARRFYLDNELPSGSELQIYA